MVVGAMLFAESFGFLSKNVLRWFDLGPVTLPELSGVPAWAIFSVLAAAAAALFRLVGRVDYSRT
jgi:hypothetical protein